MRKVVSATLDVSRRLTDGNSLLLLHLWHSSGLQIGCIHTCKLFHRYRGAGVLMAVCWRHVSRRFNTLWQIEKEEI